MRKDFDHVKGWHVFVAMVHIILTVAYKAQDFIRDVEVFERILQTLPKDYLLGWHFPWSRGLFSCVRNAYKYGVPLANENVHVRSFVRHERGFWWITFVVFIVFGQLQPSEIRNEPVRDTRQRDGRVPTVD